MGYRTSSSVGRLEELRTFFVFLDVLLASIGTVGLVVAGLLLSKMSGVLIVPMAVMCGAARLFWKKPLVVGMGTEKIIRSRIKACIAITATLGTIAIISIIVVWSFYGFRRLKSSRLF